MYKSSFNRKSYHIFLGVQILLIVILGTFMFVKSKYDVPAFLFWPIFLSVIFFGFYGIKNFSSRNKIILILIILVLSISTIKLLGYPEIYQMPGQDDYYEVGYASTLIDNEYWDINAGHGRAENYYGAFPGIHLLLSSSSIISGLDIFLFSKYFYWPFLLVMYVLLSYILFSKLLNENKDKYYLSALATLFYMSTIGIMIIHISRRTFADLFALVILYCLINILTEENGKKMQYSILLIISLMMVSISHHFTSYIVLFIFTCIFILFFKSNFRENLNRILLSFVFIFTWILYVALFVLEKDIIGAINVFSTTLFKNTDVSAVVMTNYNFIEQFLPYISQAIFLSLALIGLIYIIKRKNILEVGKLKLFIIFMVIFSLGIYAASVFILNTKYYFISLSSMWFAGFFLSIASVYGVSFIQEKYNQENKKFLLILLMMIFVIYSGNILLTHGARFIDKPYYSMLTLEDMRLYNCQYYDAGNWMSVKLDPNGKVYTDASGDPIYGGYFNLNVVGAGADKYLFQKPYLEPRHLERFKYVVTSVDITKYSSRWMGMPLKMDKLKKFDNTTFIVRIYDNGKNLVYSRSN